MTPLQKIIFNEIKRHNANDDYLLRYNRGIKFLSIGRYIHKGYNEYMLTGFKTDDGENVSMAKYEVKCLFKPEHKGDNNVVKYMFNLYSDGTHGIYFDGTEYK